MSSNSKIEWTDATWNPIRARLVEDLRSDRGRT
jgi:protein gp37